MLEESFPRPSDGAAKYCPAVVTFKIAQPAGFIMAGDTYCPTMEEAGNGEQYMYYIFSRTSVGTTNDGSSAYSVGAHGNVGNFVYADGHAGSMQGFGEYRGVVKTMFTSQGLSTTYTACYNSGKVLNY